MIQEKENQCKFVSRQCSRNIIESHAQFDKLEALEESRKVLALLGSPRLNAQIIEAAPVQTTCHYCQNLFNANLCEKCKFCNEEFCSSHRAEINHKCKNLNEHTATYLNAKSLFKQRLRDAKGKK
jgi:hypothetical protein